MMEENTDGPIIYDNGYKALDVINDFIKFYKDNKKIAEDNECEISLYSLPISYFRHLYYYSLKNVQSYKRTYFKLQINSSEGYKLRQIVNFDNVRTYNVSNDKIVSYIDKDIWNKKIPQISKDIKVDNVSIGDFKIATETDTKQVMSQFLLDNIQISFIRSIDIEINSIILRFRLIAKIGRGSQKKTCLLDYLTNVSKPKNHECIAEMEIRNDKLKSTDTLFQDLSKSFQILFGYNKLEYLRILSTPDRTILKTFVTGHQEILQLPLNKIGITPKVDGESVNFVIRNNIAEVSYRYRRLMFRCNINTKDVIIGQGEFLYGNSSDDKNRIHQIYPYYIFDNNKSRIDAINDFMSKYSDDVSPGKEEELHFKSKPFKSGFTSTKDLLIKIYDMLMHEYIFNRDGLIVFDPDENGLDKITDYKVKFDNTIDIMSTIDVNRGLVTYDNKLGINLYVKYPNKETHKENDIYIELDKTRFIDLTLGMLIIKDHKLPIVIPNYFISEYSFISKTIIKVRMDKTDRLYMRDNKYFGNPYNIVEKSKSIHDHNHLLDMNLISEIKNNPDNWPDDIKLSDLFKSIQNVPLYYYNPAKQSIRTPLHLFTNFNKTNLISTYLNPLLTGKQYKSVLDIDAGNGGDMNKLFYMNVKEVIATDIDELALNEYKSRYDAMHQGPRVRMFDLKLINSSIKDSDFKTKIRNVFHGSFDAINYQLAIHFYWTDEYIPTILSTLESLSRIGTRVLITTNDGIMVDKMLRNENLRDFIIDTERDIYFRIRRDGENKIRTLNNISSNNLEPLEYLVIPNNLIASMKTFGFDLLNTFLFSDIYDFKDSFSTMADSYQKKSPKDLFSNIRDNLRREIKNNDLKELLSCYRGYAFEFTGFRPRDQKL